MSNSQRCAGRAEEPGSEHIAHRKRIRGRCTISSLFPRDSSKQLASRSKLCIVISRALQLPLCSFQYSLGPDILDLISKNVNKPRNGELQNTQLERAGVNTVASIENQYPAS